MKKREEKMTNADYHADKAYGSTSIKKAIHSMAKFKAYIDDVIPQKESSAYDFGTAAHSVILEKSMDSFVVMPDFKPKGKVTKKSQVLAFEEANPGKKFLKTDQFDLLKGVYESFFAHGLASKMVSKGQAEQSFFATLNGVDYKARADWITEECDGFYLFDYKTCVDSTHEGFQKAIANYGYDVSAAHYKKVMEEVLGKKCKDFFWIAQEKEAPFSIGIYRMDDDLATRAEGKIINLHTKIQFCAESGNFPDRVEEILDIDLPHWAVRKLEQESRDE